VEEAIAELEANVGRETENARAHAAREGQLEAALQQTREACFARDRRIERLAAELDLSRSEAESRLRGLAALGAELEALRVSSRGTATRIRLQALKEAGAVGASLRDLSSDPDASNASLMAALERALDRIAADWSGEEAHAESAEELAHMGADLADTGGLEVPEPEGEIVIRKAADAVSPDAAGGNGTDPGPAVATGHRLSVDVGPFHDFSQLVAFEDAANAIPATGDISIRRFSGGRAEIDIDLTDQIDLLAELGRHCDLTLEIRSQQGDLLVLDVA
jgi:hypothetical protein